MKESSSSESSVEAFEEGAHQARKGYDYQDLVAAGYCIQMLSEKSILRVECETSEDIVLTVGNVDAGEVREFVQVKSNRLDQKWTVAKLCASERKAEAAPQNSQIKKDQSILEKNALRQRGHSNAKFRMVTRTDVKDFDVLTVPTEDRDPQALDALRSAIHEKIEERTTLSRAEIEYWVQHVSWEVLGTQEALFNHNLRLLQEQIEETENRVLPLFDLENLLRELVDETQSMATATGRIGDNRSSVTTDELRKWLATKVKKIPQYLGSEERTALLRMERESVARCEALWLALGVAQEEAESLARQPTIGV